MSRSLPITRTLRPVSLLTALAALCAALALLPGAARAGAYTYSAGAGTQRTVNAGVLLLDGTVGGGQNVDPTGQGADDKDPYVFYILNQRIDIKPFGWNIVNPLAPPSVTSTVYQRWLNRTPTADQPTYQLGQTLTPAMAAYWEVPLATTASGDLSKFDILFLNLEQSPAFTALDAEKLRRFVDGGGTLWIENSGTATTTTVPGLFFNLTFNNNSGTTGSASVPGLIQPPLISQPYQLSAQELNTLGANHIGGFYANNGAGANPPQDASGRLVFATIVGNSGNSNQPVIAEAAYGAGDIVITTTGSANAINEYVGGVNVGVGGNSGPFCGLSTQNAPTADLKLLCDIIASTGAHLNEHQNGHQTGDDTDSLSSAVQTWHYSPLTQTALPAGAVIYGHIAYAVVGGSLTAFDLYPAESLFGTGNPDDGIQDYNTGTSYDVIWTVPLNGSASAPTIGFDKNNNAVVLVELADGSVRSFEPFKGGVSSLGMNPLANSGGRGTYASTMPVPAPTFYGGRIYAGGQDGTLYIYDVTTGAGNKVTVDSSLPSGTAGNPILAAPTVGIIPNDSSGVVPDNDIVALCVTRTGLFSVFLGSRGELLTMANGQAGSFNTKLSTLTGSLMDTTVGTQQTYSLTTDNEKNFLNLNANPMSPFFTGGPSTGQVYADYDADFANTASPANLTRTYAATSSMAAFTASGTSYTGALYVSTPALDRLGNVYYTVTDANGSSLVSVHDGPNLSRIHINWRFLLPTATADPGLDADGTNYAPLTGYQFTTTANGSPVPSAPVVDAQGNVYVLATKAATGGIGATSGAAAILSFNTQAAVSATAVDVTGQVAGITNVAITQPIPASGTTDEFGPGDTPVTLTPSQYTLTSAGQITFTDFGQHGGVMLGTASIYPDLNEPYPITVGFSTAGGVTSQNQNVRPLHTNLAWYTVLTNTASSGLTLVGGSLYFVDGAGDLTSVPADPSGAGFTITNKFVNSVTAPGAAPLVTSLGDAGDGPTTAVPSASNGALLVNGPQGLTAFTNQVTLVVDAGRVLEMNASGDAQWAVDSTTKTTLVGGTVPVYNNGTSGTATGQYVSTTLGLNRPTSLTELTANDYLIADTGNNRCVRFDRGGQVIWELTKFTDIFSKLAPGEPATLNQPTSVQIRSDSKDANGNPLLDANGKPETIVRYLVSDTGNDRIVEVDDVFDQYFNYEIDSKSGLPEYHVLNWISHTHDVQNRDYRYQSAAYYASPVSGKYYVVALITNKRLATFVAPAPAAGQYGTAAPNLLGPANQDVAGGTIALLDYDPTNYYGTATFGANNQADGFIATTVNPNAPVPGDISPIAVSTIAASLTGGGNFDPTGTSAAKTLYIRNPRYLKVVTKLQPGSNGTTVSARHYLLADDNGVWDLDGTTFVAQFGFTQADYQAVTTPISQDGVTGTTLQGQTTAQQIQFLRSPNPNAPSGIPFVPTAIQLTGTDQSTPGGPTYGRYLITNSYSQGEAANNTGNLGAAYVPPTTLPTTTPGFGGEVFEVHYVVSNSGSGGYVETHDTMSVTAPRYTGHTISRPSGTNTSPLSQPAFAYRLQF